MQENSTVDKLHLPNSNLPRVLVIGGGFAGISLVNKLKNKPVQIVILDKNNFHLFQPLLYQVSTCGIEPDSIVFPLRKLFKGYKNVLFRMAEVNVIQSDINTIKTDHGVVEYDYLVIATGSKTNFYELLDVKDNSFGMKSIQESLDIRNNILQNLEKAAISCDESERDALTNFAIIGGGLAGIETAGAIAEFKKYILPKDYPELDVSIMSIYLIEAGGKLLQSMSNKSSERARRYLDKMKVDIQLNTVVNSYDGLHIKTNKGVVLKARTVIWTAGVIGNLPSGIEVECISKNNRIIVDEYCKIKGHNNIYAVGDIASMISDEYPSGHPMVAQVAIQQGKQLARNIILQDQSKELIKFSYRAKGSLATIGKRKAVADFDKLSFGGYFAWLLWSVVHLVSIIGFRNKLQVLLNWAWGYFTYEKGNRSIF